MGERMGVVRGVMALAAVSGAALLLWRAGMGYWAATPAVLLGFLVLPKGEGTLGRIFGGLKAVTEVSVTSVFFAALAMFAYWGGVEAPGVAAAVAGLDRSGGTTPEIFNGTVSTVYALVVAFIIFKGMQDFDQANFALRDEAMRIWSISRNLAFFAESDRARNPTAHDRNLVISEAIREQMLAYLTDLRDALDSQQEGVAENEERIVQAERHVAQLEPIDDNDRVALQSMMSTLSDLSGIRARRMALMAARPSVFMVVMLILLSVLIITPFFALGVSGLYLDGDTVMGEPQATVFQSLEFWAVGALAFTLSFLFVMLMDMSSPFDGHWTVKREGLNTAIKRISWRIEENADRARDARARLTAVDGTLS